MSNRLARPKVREVYSTVEKLQQDLVRAWRDNQVAELRGIVRGKAIGRLQGFMVGALGMAVLIIAASDILWRLR